MTISSTTRVAGPFNGAGTTATFPFTFKVFDVGDIYVVRINTATGAIAVLALTADFTAALNADQDASPGGSITLTAGNLATGLTLTITTDMAELQGVDLTNGGGFFPDVINGALDAAVILIQQLQLQLNRAVQAPFGDNSAMLLPAAVQRAGKVVGFDSGGNLALVSIVGGGGGGGGGVISAPQTCAGTVDSVNTAFTFTAPAGSTPSILVFAGGIFQGNALGADYGLGFVSGTTWRITFTTAPSNAPIMVLVIG